MRLRLLFLSLLIISCSSGDGSISDLPCFVADSIHGKEFIYGDTATAPESFDLGGELLIFKYEEGDWRMWYQEANGELGQRQRPRSFSIDRKTGAVKYVKPQGDLDSAVFDGKLTCDALTGSYKPYSGMEAMQTTRKRVW